MPTGIPTGQQYNFSVVYGNSLRQSMFIKPKHHRDAPHEVCPDATCVLSIDQEYSISLASMSLLLVEGTLVPAASE
jgi:lipopolysaccharide biosynthesis protein